jgi:hypothetical protein
VINIDQIVIPFREIVEEVEDDDKIHSLLGTFFVNGKHSFTILFNGSVFTQKRWETQSPTSF